MSMRTGMRLKLKQIDFAMRITIPIAQNGPLNGRPILITFQWPDTAVLFVAYRC
jgi:hypothetical protein